MNKVLNRQPFCLFSVHVRKLTSDAEVGKQWDGKSTGGGNRETLLAEPFFSWRS